MFISSQIPFTVSSRIDDISFLASSLLENIFRSLQLWVSSKCWFDTSLDGHGWISSSVRAYLQATRRSPIHFRYGTVDQISHGNDSGVPAKMSQRRCSANSKSESHKLCTTFLNRGHATRSVPTRHLVTLLECIELHHVKFFRSLTLGIFPTTSLHRSSGQCSVYR